MNIKYTLLAAATAVASLLGLSPVTAQAGSLDNAAVACYVDTYAYDLLSTDFCAGVWTPGTADINSIAHFEVIGLPPGNYSFYWNHNCGNSSTCQTPITARPEQEIKGSVWVVNNSTGEQRGLYAYAMYINGWD